MNDVLYTYSLFQVKPSKYHFLYVTNIQSTHQRLQGPFLTLKTLVHSGPPMVTSFEPNPTNAFENNQTQFECHGEGLPLPSFAIKKVHTGKSIILFKLLTKQISWWFSLIHGNHNKPLYGTAMLVHL